MGTQNKTNLKEFHAVEFMRQVRSELSEKYLNDKTQYLEDLKNAMADFRRRQEKAYSQQSVFKIVNER
jgi:hypothetical protein